MYSTVAKLHRPISGSFHVVARSTFASANVYRSFAPAVLSVYNRKPAGFALAGFKTSAVRPKNLTETVKDVGHEANMKAGIVVNKVLEQVEKVSEKASEMKDEIVNKDVTAADVAKSAGYQASQAANETIAVGKAKVDDVRSTASEKYDQAKQQTGAAVDSATRSVKQAAGQTKDMGQNAVDKTKSMSQEAVDKTKNVGQEVVDKTKNMSNQAYASGQGVAREHGEGLEEEAIELAEDVKDKTGTQLEKGKGMAEQLHGQTRKKVAETRESL
ncbi:hypothetical protein BC938DRAFT_473394 [Jimgerdemannia flammicorona]|uniref:Uncharacterized protein n=1 Tax=Jimgerdemannia flammicorona TaxID=994334 RepID=A0A433Q416_9FUNG|nr:hypothetical protein BC938DRAFT_473394 [Jimgerdemannia flammicorona]